MKKIAIAGAVLLAFSGPVLASEEGKSAANFDERKAEILKRIDDQIQRFQESKTCIIAAKNHNEMKACKEKQVMERKKLREEMKRR
jgi:hypothetical protein